MPTDQQKPNTNRSSLRVEIDREIDAQLEREIAGTNLTKREVVEEALRRELARMKQDRAA